MKLDIKEDAQAQAQSGARSAPVTPKRTRTFNLWRTTSMIQLRGKKKEKQSRHTINGDPNQHNMRIIAYDKDRAWQASTNGKWDTILNIVLVEAKGLPDLPEDGASHHLYCKFRLGSESVKSKAVTSALHPQWRERLKMHLYNDPYLNVTLWDKGKQKNFMGSCRIDLTKLEKERTHEIWQELEDGFGSVHFSVTMCVVRQTNGVGDENEPLIRRPKSSPFDWYDLNSDWNSIGKLYVKLVCARGLRSKSNNYCTIELDNERVQTHVARSSSEPTWNKKYIFTVHDVTSTLDLKVHDSSLVTSLVGDCEGKVSIPLLRINNGEAKWYALKDRSKRHGAKGNCPRVLLEMYMIWNPVKATFRLFSPKEKKYIKKSTKFDVALVHSNMEFVKQTFLFLNDINEAYKRLFEWENQELSFVILVGWLVFWYNFKPWTTPLMLLMPILYNWAHRRNKLERLDFNSNMESETELESDKSDKPGITMSKIQALPETTLIITNGIEYLASVWERVCNLVNFEVPFLTYLTMIFLVGISVVLYLVPFNYLLMALGMYKFTRKYLNPDRTLNNDLLDFLSRIPDNEILRNWKELSVPEPHHSTVKSKII